MPDNADKSNHQDKHEIARNLAEDALGAYAKGKKAEGDRLADEAQRTDRSAVEEVLRDLDEDAGSDPNAVLRER
jgi:hypothetical protein